MRADPIGVILRSKPQKNCQRFNMGRSSRTLSLVNFNLVQIAGFYDPLVIEEEVKDVSYILYLSIL
jgi:hypothetical protein